ncbi:hypothetical protein [Nakamurella sp.]|uniref:hypothetical protein n=1 Tax=Nakamurella sp. TaxID=1869182 RepID=UPI003B3BAA78
MSSPVTVQPVGPRPRRRPRWGLMAAIAIGAVLTVLLVTVVVEVVTADRWAPPAFPSLAAQPDPTLQGTVAYFAAGPRCVRVVAASGQPEKDALCVGDQVTTTTGAPATNGATRAAPASGATTATKEMGPQLVWRSDGRLEITMFRVADPGADRSPGLHLAPGWQKVVDVVTGQVQDVPSSDLPAEPAQLPAPTVNAAGERVDTVTTDGQTAVVLDAGAGARTLLSFPAAPPDANYQFGPAFWAPTGDWIAAGDGRFLIITPTDPATTRVLRDDARAASLVSSPEFAVTDRNLLTGAG